MPGRAWRASAISPPLTLLQAHQSSFFSSLRHADRLLSAQNEFFFANFLQVTLDLRISGRPRRLLSASRGANPSILHVSRSWRVACGRCAEGSGNAGRQSLPPVPVVATSIRGSDPSIVLSDRFLLDGKEGPNYPSLGSLKRSIVDLCTVHGSRSY